MQGSHAEDELHPSTRGKHAAVCGHIFLGDLQPDVARLQTSFFFFF